MEKTNAALFFDYKYNKSLEHRNWLQRTLGYCPQCNRWFRKVSTVRQPSAYLDEECNYFTGCAECQERNDEYWDAQWENLYG